jgi:transmembrane sensor
MDHLYRLHFLFDKYLRRQCTGAELEELIALLQEADAEKSLTEPMQELWLRLKDDTTTHEVDWDKMYNTILNAAENEASPMFNRNNVFKIWYKAAAAVIVLIVAAGGYLYFSNHTKTIAENNIAENKNSNKEQPINKRQTIHLPDGSTVILNADSKLNYPAAFSGNTREVYLTGEGYFDIKHNPKQPFLVHAGKIITKVLGTAFDIKAYPLDESVEVTVTRGKVQVLKENKSLGLVTANQQISFSKKTELFAQKIVDAKLVIAWKPGEIIFNDITMQEAAKRIEQRFNTTIEFANPAIKNCMVTATFSEDDLEEEILTVICGVSKSNYTILNNKITIDGKGCNE